MRLRQILSRYINSWWLPATVFLVLLVIFAGTVFTGIALWDWQGLPIVANVLVVCLASAFLGVLSASVCNFIKKHWAKAIVNLVMLPLCGVATLLAVGFLMVASMSSEDHFADDLKVPQDIPISEAGDELSAEPGGPEDTFQAGLLKALKTPGGNDPSVTGDIPSLARLQKEDPEVLRRYFATSPAWRVFREHGALFATRRWMIGSQWRYTLHGYYSRDFDMYQKAHKAHIPDFQSRLTIGLSGRPWARGSGNSTCIRIGETAPLKLSVGNQMYESHCVITTRELVVEVFEQSTAKERCLTKAALAHLDEDLQPLAAAPGWSTIQRILPRGSIRTGTPSFELRKSFQPGIYDSYTWVNPGEPGMLYLKAYEVTRGTPLSADGLREYSNELVGWSEDPQQVFFSNTHFTICEGDWGKPYAARFELWFVPDSGAPERKLMEKVFRIEGWQR